MHAEYAQTMYDADWTDVLRSLGPGTFSYESVFQKNTGYVGTGQVYSNRTVTTLKAKAIVAYPDQIILFNISKRYHNYLIDRGHEVLSPLPVLTFEAR